MSSVRNPQLSRFLKLLSALGLGISLVFFSTFGAQAIGTPPGPPTGLSAAVSGSTVVVMWTNTADSNFVSATITASPGGESCTVVTNICSFTTLIPGISYTFTGISNSSDGSGPSVTSTASNAVSFIGVPTPPLNLVASESQGITTVSWTTPYSNGGTSLLSSLVTASNGATCSAIGADTSCTFTGLTSGSSYTFTATSTNAQGTSGASSVASFVVPLANTGAQSVSLVMLSIVLTGMGALALGTRQMFNRRVRISQN